VVWVKTSEIGSPVLENGMFYKTLCILWYRHYETFNRKKSNKKNVYMKRIIPL